MARRKILVCGSQGWSDRAALNERLSRQDVLSALVIHGGAPGADQMADDICIYNKVHTFICNARWHGFGRKAGALRNFAMLDLEPDRVIAFSLGTPGTQITIDEARKRGIPVEVHGTERVRKGKSDG